MRLTEIALAITLVLLAITAYLAYEGHKDRFASDEADDVRALQRGEGSVEQRLAAVERQMATIRQDQARQTDPVRPSLSGAEASDPSGLQLPPPPQVAGSSGDPLERMIERGDSPPRPPSVIHEEPTEPPLSEMERQVLRASAIARVESYDADYNVLQINIGSERGVREGVEFSIRRGKYLLGNMRVTLVEENAAAGEMMLGSMPDGLVVEEGDDVIQKITRGL